VEWEFKSGAPIYQQIVLAVKFRIANGTYPPGSKFPAVRELALEAGVNPNTMQRALAELEREGLLMTVRTSGRLVTGNEERLRMLRMELGNSFIGDMFVNLRRLGLSDEEIVEAVRSWRQEAADRGKSLPDEIDGQAGTPASVKEGQNI
jgi:DNA-binding transcriptional regulator YhcF (GntR family)